MFYLSLLSETEFRDKITQHTLLVLCYIIIFVYNIIQFA